MALLKELVPPDQIECDQRFVKSGLYESFYFRGDSLDGEYSFWLKHNFIRFKNSLDVRCDNYFILFDYRQNKTFEWHQSQIFNGEQWPVFLNQGEKNWKNLRVNFQKDGFFEVQENKLQGLISSEQGPVSWNFDLVSSGERYYHFDQKRFYTGPFPKKKILTNDICLQFNGAINAASIGDIKKKFVGMNGHNWGKEHAYAYAYADCTRFEGVDPGEVYFDGFSAKIKIGPVITPFLSGASIKIGKEYFHFNSVWQSWQNSVTMFELKKWSVIYFNSNYQFEVNIDGQQALWQTLSYDHPSGKKSFVHNCKNASGNFFLRSSTGQILRQFTSRWVELETLLP